MIPLELSAEHWVAENPSRRQEDLPRQNFPAAELRAAGFKCRELKEHSYSASQMKDCCRIPDDSPRKGRTLTYRVVHPEGAAVRADMSSSTIRKTLPEGEIIEFGGIQGDDAQLKDRAGWTSIRSPNGEDILVEVNLGYTCEELKEGGYIAAELREAGFPSQMMREALFEAAEMKDAGYTAEEMKAGGYEVG